MTPENDFMNVIEYIEKNLAKSIQIDEIAAVAYRSTMQLYRDFYTYTGFSVKEYIRRRRLSKALALLKSSDMSLSDIAYELGYSSQQAFCKIVKTATTMTPLEYKLSDSQYYFPVYQQPVSTCSNVLCQINVSSLTIPETLCISYCQDNQEQLEMNAVNHLTQLLPEFHGRLFGRNGNSNGSRFCYELLLESSQLTSQQQLCLAEHYPEITLLPEVTCSFATTITDNKVDQIINSWNYLYNTWMPNSMFHAATLPYFEEYLLQKGNRSKLMLYLPLEKQTSPDNIQIRELKSTYYLIASAAGDNAEETAAADITQYLKSAYPYLLNRSNYLYFQQYNTRCSCGIQLEYPLLPPSDSKVTLLTLPEGRYACLKSSHTSDFAVLQNRLSSLLRENGFTTKPSSYYALYPTNSHTQSSGHKAVIYTMLQASNKNVKNG